MNGRALALGVLVVSIGCFDEPGADTSDGAESTAGTSTSEDSTTSPAMTSGSTTSGGTAVVDEGTSTGGDATSTDGDSSTGTMPPQPGCECPLDPEPTICDSFEELGPAEEFKGWVAGAMGANPPTQTDDAPQCGDWAMQSTVPMGGLFSQLVHPAQDVASMANSVFVAHTYFRVDDCPQAGDDRIPIRLTQLRLDAANFQFQLQVELQISPDGTEFQLAPITNPVQGLPIALGPFAAGWHELQVTVDNTGVEPSISASLDGNEQPPIMLDAFDPLVEASWIVGLARNAAFTDACTVSYDLAWMTIGPS